MSDANDILQRLVAQRQKAPLTLNAFRTALVVVDMQRYYLRPDSPYSRFLELRAPGYTGHLVESVERSVLPKAAALVARFRSLGLPVLWTALDSAQPDGSDLPSRLGMLNALAVEAGLPPAIPHRDDPWAGFTEGLAPLEGEAVVHKTTFGGFATGDLETRLRALDAVTLIMCGVVTNVCVESTAREAVDRGFEVIVASDACGAYAPEVHQAHLTSFQVAFGAVRDTESLLNALPLPTAV